MAKPTHTKITIEMTLERSSELLGFTEREVLEVIKEYIEALDDAEERKHGEGFVEGVLFDEVLDDSGTYRIETFSKE